MKYVIMCGGKYDDFSTPKSLSVIGGERLADRTIRLLRENGADDICISSNENIFDSCGVPRLEHYNSYHVVFNENGKQLKGYWLDAFYPHFEDDVKATFLFGDVYYTPEAIKKIMSCKRDGNILFGSGAAANPLHKNWGEPYAYVVNDYVSFMQGVKAVKKLQDEGKLLRVALVWELYRYLNNLDINTQAVLLNDTYFVIDDITIDIDAPWQIKKLNEKVSP